MLYSRVVPYQNHAAGACRVFDNAIFGVRFIDIEAVLELVEFFDNAILFKANEGE